MWTGSVGRTLSFGQLWKEKAYLESGVKLSQWYWLGAMCLLQLTDALATQALVSRSMVHEANSLMASLLSSGDFLLFKVSGVGICALLLWGFYRVLPKMAKTLNVFIVVFYTAILLWNLKVSF